MTAVSSRPYPLPLVALAPAKINLGLFVGPTREDGRHELVSAMQSISLADTLTLRAAPGAADEVECPGVAGENLALRAIELFREATGWDGAPVTVSIEKRIPVAAGLGGGSADAAATLRLLRAASGVEEEDDLSAVGARLGADVPAQVSPGRWLATGAGEQLELLPDPVSPIGVLVLPQAQGLSTADAYAQADRMGSARDMASLGERQETLRRALELGAGLPADSGLLDNDLQAASLALCPQIEQALSQAREAGAEVAFVSGSGPTVVGLFARANGPERARRAAAGLAGREPPALAAESVGAPFAAVRPLAG